jgi:hypothetical protein
MAARQHGSIAAERKKKLPISITCQLFVVAGRRSIQETYSPLQAAFAYINILGSLERPSAYYQQRNNSNAQTGARLGVL